MEENLLFWSLRFALSRLFFFRVYECIRIYAVYTFWFYISWFLNTLYKTQFFDKYFGTPPLKRSFTVYCITEVVVQMSLLFFHYLIKRICAYNLFGNKVYLVYTLSKSLQVKEIKGWTLTRSWILSKHPQHKVILRAMIMFKVFKRVWYMLNSILEKFYFSLLMINITTKTRYYIDALFSGIILAVFYML